MKDKWQRVWDSNPDNPFRGNNGFRDRRPTIRRTRYVAGEVGIEPTPMVLETTALAVTLLPIIDYFPLFLPL